MPLKKLGWIHVSAYWVAAIVVSFSPFVGAYAEEVRLICQGVDSGVRRVKTGERYDQFINQTVSVFTEIPYETELLSEVRFDEDKQLLWYRGDQALDSDLAEDGWIPADKVQFADEKVTALFGISDTERADNIMRSIATLGLASAFGRRDRDVVVAEIDRYTGILRIRDNELTCTVFETADRKF